MSRIKVKAFGLVELMISLVLASIVVVGLYQYFIKGTRQMSDVIVKTGVENMAIRAFNSIVSDIKLIGHNPEEIINAAVDPATDPNNGFLNDGSNTMGLSLPLADMPLDMPLYRPALRVGDLSSIVYSEFHDDQPTCCGNDTSTTTNLPDPKYSDMGCNPLCSNALDGLDKGDLTQCCCNRYSIGSGTISKEYWNFNSSGPEQIILLNNSCLRFIYWDIDNDAPCQCQDGRKCQNEDTSGSNPCPDNFLDKPPKGIKLILAAVMDERFNKDFIDDCQTGITGRLMPGAGNCDVSQECRIPPAILKPSQYVRFEKVVYLTNLFRPQQN